MENKDTILTEDVFARIRWGVDFIGEEAFRVGGSDEVKDKIKEACDSFRGEVFPKIGTEISEEDFIKLIKKELKSFDSIIEEIRADEENRTLFMLLITHIADIKFLLLNKEEQEKIKKLN
jgi:hypothetical protein